MDQCEEYYVGPDYILVSWAWDGSSFSIFRILIGGNKVFMFIERKVNQVITGGWVGLCFLLLVQSHFCSLSFFLFLASQFQSFFIYPKRISIVYSLFWHLIWLINCLLYVSLSFSEKEQLCDKYLHIRTTQNVLTFKWNKYFF